MTELVNNSSTHQRELACKLATVDTQKAYATAKRIESPLFRCQALACVARYADDNAGVGIVADAFAAADKADDAYLRISATAWPLRALIERERLEQARECLQIQLTRVSQIVPDSSRSEALFLVFQAVFPAGQEFWRPVIDQLAEVADTPPHWRTIRNLQEAILMIADEAPDLASQMADRLPAGRRRRQLESQLTAGMRRQPREFFWRT